MAATAASSSRQKPLFEIRMASGEVIRGELYPKAAPETVGNFLSLAQSGFYDGLAFHRCVRGFIAQAGQPLKGALPYCIYGEFEFNGCAYNRLSPETGSLCMSRGAHYDSASSEFFIVTTEDVQELRYLDGAYAVFGKVLQGLDVIRSLADVPVRPDTHEPVNPQVIRSLRVETFGESYPFTPLEIPDSSLNRRRRWPRGRVRHYPPQEAE